MAGATIFRSLVDILSGPVAFRSLRVVNFLNTASSDILVNLKLVVTGCSWQSGLGDVDLIDVEMDKALLYIYLHFYNLPSSLV